MGAQKGKYWGIKTEKEKKKKKDNAQRINIHFQPKLPNKEENKGRHN